SGRLVGCRALHGAYLARPLLTFPNPGLPCSYATPWSGPGAPPPPPADLAEKLNRDVVETLKGREVTDMLRKISLEPGATSPGETGKFFAEETALWRKVIKQAGIEPQ